jgi:hypothetical protein
MQGNRGNQLTIASAIMGHGKSDSKDSTKTGHGHCLRSEDNKKMAKVSR